MSAQLSAAEALSKAADLLETEGAWIKGAYCSGDLRAFCMAGAVNVVQGLSPYNEGDTPAMMLLRAVVAPDYIAEFNDAPDRTQAEVVAKLREVAALATGETPR